MYDVVADAFRVYDSVGLNPVWLGDSRRVLFTRDSFLMLMDTQTGEEREVLDVSPDTLFSVTDMGGRGLVLARTRVEGDIWMALLGADESAAPAGLTD